MNLSHLNPEQHMAVTTTEGPLLVLAGAGSGKTKVIVHRIAYIAEQGRAHPSQILALTFTNKAAAEMKTRLGDMLGEEARSVWMGTFHSIGLKLMRPWLDLIGFSAPVSIYNEEAGEKMVKRCLADAYPNKDTASAKDVLGEISRAKDRGVTPAVLAQLEPFRFSSAAKYAVSVYDHYQSALQRANAVDFGDILLFTKRLLRDYPGVRAQIAGRFRYVLVDEFQDTNTVQMEILSLLTATHRNLCVVGDDQQGIYRFRGAEPRNILDFGRHFPDARTIKLERNYRSTSNILAAANGVIRRNRTGIPKTLRTTAPAGDPIRLSYVADSETEAQHVADTIRRHVEAGGRPDDAAVLYRQNAQSRSLEIALRRADLPYVLIGGTAFFERKEVKDILAYLRLVVNPSSEDDLVRVLGAPPRGVGDTTIDRLRALGQQHAKPGVRVLELDDEALIGADVARRQITALRALADLLGKLRELASRASAAQVARVLIEKIGYVEYLRRSEPQTAQDREANVSELVTALGEVDASAAPDPERSPLDLALESIALSSASDDGGEAGKVSLMTIHGSKGLEFPLVFLVGCEEGTFPHSRAIEGDAEDMEEERRLCYVALTRARTQLHLYCAMERRIYGTTQVRAPSRFLGEIPASLVEVRGRPMVKARPSVALGGAR